MTARVYAPVGCAAVLLLLAACGGEQPEDAAAASDDAHEAPVLGVELDAEEQEKLGVELGEVQPASLQPGIDGPAHVVDAQTVVGAMADLGKAEAQTRASQAALKRARDLFAIDTAVSAATLETAERQAADDDAQLRVARAHATLSFGAAAPWLDPERRTAVLAGLSAGTMLLVSASFPSGLGDAQFTSLALRRVGAAPAETWMSTELWTGPADTNVPGPTVLALLDAPATLSYGERLTATVVNGAPITGTVVPASAVVLAGGEPWCYVLADDVFVRRSVDIGRPLAQGYFQARDFAAGERVVVAGAGLLLARELGGGAEED